ncbi:DUF6545 domain-containing protein [Cryobacterium cryoconiti]|uniref:DUF6545 domain-containing protein n=1 Tax=Cryobacterium cryoconiti TaxID=1259239 RepID=A0A4Y8K0E8_9MICO|nr:DUF6545 domain-containing protein [Cryobacterium cryoconiti]TFD33390.1 hypothetical protein E3T49_03685 [Cryobacterium cryoconiti]
MQVILVTVSVVLWVAVAVCVPSFVRGQRRLLFWVLSALATTLTLQPDVVYYRIDPLIGGVHVTYFIFHATAIISVALVSNLVQEAIAPHGLTRRRMRATAVFAGSIILVQAILFFGGDWHLTDDIRQPFLSRVDYALYAASTWITMAFFSVSVAVACLSDRRTQRRTVTRIALGSLVFGCFWILVYTMISLGSAAASLTLGSFVFSGWLLFLYQLSLLGALISLAVGLSLTAAVDSIRFTGNAVQDRRLLWRVTPLWERVLAGSPELSIERHLSRPGLLVVRSPGAHLYRRYVEIRDSMLLEPGQHLSAGEQRLIDQVEDHVRTRPPAFASPVSVTQQRISSGPNNHE